MSEPNPELSVACVLIAHLPAKAEMRRYSALRGRPLVVVEMIGLRELVLDYSAVAEAAGVTEGMPLTDAIALCPQAVLMQADAKYYSDTHNRLADALAMRCPEVEVDGMGCLYASLEGLSEIHGGEARLAASLLQSVPPPFNPRLGVACAKFPAYVAAATAPHGRAARAPLDTRAFLAGCSVNLLPLPWESKERLDRYGIRTLGRLAAMPGAEALAMLGAEGQRAWELVRGIDREPLPNIHRAAA